MSTLLLQAQQVGAQAAASSLYLTYKTSYLQKQTGISGMILRRYAEIYSFASPALCNAAKKIDFVACGLFSKIYSHFCANHLVEIKKIFASTSPSIKKLESNILDRILEADGYWIQKCAPIKNGEGSQNLQEIFNNILDNNKSLNTHRLNKKVHFVKSMHRGVFSSLDKGIYITSSLYQFLKKRKSNLNKKDCKINNFIELKKLDGSMFKIDISNISLQDLLASLISKEITSLISGRERSSMIETLASIFLIFCAFTCSNYFFKESDYIGFLPVSVTVIIFLHFSRVKSELICLINGA